MNGGGRRSLWINAIRGALTADPMSAAAVPVPTATLIADYAFGWQLCCGLKDKSVRVFELGASTAEVVAAADASAIQPPAALAPVASLRGHERAVICLAVLRDGRVASGSNDESIRIWSADQSARCDLTIDSAHAHPITCLVALPDGRLASASRGKTIKIWSFPRVMHAHALEAAYKARKSEFDKAFAEWEHDASLAHAARERARQERLKARAKLKPHLTTAELEREDATAQNGDEPDDAQAEADHRAELRADPDEPDDAKLARRERARTAALKATDLASYLRGRKEDAIAEAVSKSFAARGGSGGAGAGGVTGVNAHLASAGAPTGLPHPDKPAPKPPVAYEGTVNAETGCAAVVDQTLDAHTASIYALFLHPDGRLVSGGTDKTIKLWYAAAPATSIVVSPRHATSPAADSKDDHPHGTEPTSDHADAAPTVAVESDVRGLPGAAATAVADAKAAAADHKEPSAATAVSTLSASVPAEPVRYKHFLTLHGHTGAVSALNALPLPDGRLLSGSTDATIRLWDTHTPDDKRQCLYTVKNAASGLVSSLAVTPDGLVVSTSPRDRELRVWHINAAADVSDHAISEQVAARKRANEAKLAVLNNAKVSSSAVLQKIKDQIAASELNAAWDIRASLMVVLDRDVRCIRTLVLTADTTATAALGVSTLHTLPDGRVAGGCDSGSVAIWALPPAARNTDSYGFPPNAFSDPNEQPAVPRITPQATLPSPADASPAGVFCLATAPF